MPLPFERQEYSWEYKDYTVSTERQRLDLTALHDLLRTEAYWAHDLELGRLRRGVECSLPFGLYDAPGTLIGFCRVVTDGATTAYLRDVIVRASHRGQGLGTALSAFACNHPDLDLVGYWLLATDDAQGVYEKLGFARPNDPGRFMVRRPPRVPWPA